MSSESARVHSIEAIRTFRDQLAQFAEDARHALDAVDMSARRSSDWLNHDMFQYWRGEIKRRNEKVSSARAELHRKRMTARSGQPAYDVEEKEALTKAQRKLEEAERKLAAVKRWMPALQHAISEYQSHGRPLGDFIAGDLQRSLAMLMRMADALDAYISIAPPSTPVAATPAAEESREATSS